MRGSARRVVIGNSRPNAVGCAVARKIKPPMVTQRAGRVVLKVRRAEIAVAISRTVALFISTPFLLSIVVPWLIALKKRLEACGEWLKGCKTSGVSQIVSCVSRKFSGIPEAVDG
jgi:hypothetical protein